MAYLFKVEGNKVVPNDETLLIEPFKTIWNNDESKGKEEALKDFAYIEFMTSYLASNPFKGYTEEVRHTILAESIYKNVNFVPGDLIKQGIESVKNFQRNASPTYNFYLSALKGKETVEKFLNSVDLTKVNYKTGTPLYKPKEITSALLDVEKVSSSLDGLKKKVEEELYEAVRTKGQKEISPFAVA